MNKETEEKLGTVRETLKEMQYYNNAANVMNYDLETICPKGGQKIQGETIAFISNQAFKLRKNPEFIEAAEYIYEHREELDEIDKILAEVLHRSYLGEKNITPEKQHEFALVLNKAYIDWEKAKREDSFDVFKDSLSEVKRVMLESTGLQERMEYQKDYSDYDLMLDNYERGMNTEKVRAAFDECKERLVPFLKKIQASKKEIRTDFLARPVTDESQRQMAQYLLEVMNFDFNRGAFTTTVHPFTETLSRNDVRVTTNYKRDNFTSSMYSIIHEGGHALFGQNVPTEDYDHYIDGNRTLGMDESVSRFYENRIGRSKEYMHLIYPKTCEIFPEAMKGVSENDLYEAVNIVTPSLIRTEADEFTYTFHIIIRFEIEQEIIAGRVKIEDVPELWNKKYEEYLGIRPTSYRTGVLQDVHWSFGFGYFPTYALGNMYNAMYINRMKNDIDLWGSVSKGDFNTVNGWMTENVFKEAERKDPADWIRDITGRDFTPKDFLDYLEEKYGELYGL